MLTRTLSVITLSNHIATGYKRLLNMLLILLLIFAEVFDITNGECLNYKQSQFMNSIYAQYIEPLLSACGLDTIYQL